MATSNAALLNDAAQSCVTEPWAIQRLLTRLLVPPSPLAAVAVWPCPRQTGGSRCPTPWTTASGSRTRPTCPPSAPSSLAPSQTTGSGRRWLPPRRTTGRGCGGCRPGGSVGAGGSTGAAAASRPSGRQVLLRLVLRLRCCESLQDRSTITSSAARQSLLLFSYSCHSGAAPAEHAAGLMRIGAPRAACCGWAKAALCVSGHPCSAALMQARQPTHHPKTRTS